MTKPHQAVNGSVGTTFLEYIPKILFAQNTRKARVIDVYAKRDNFEAPIAKPAKVATIGYRSSASPTQISSPKCHYSVRNKYVEILAQYSFGIIPFVKRGARPER